MLNPNLDNPIQMFTELSYIPLSYSHIVHGSYTELPGSARWLIWPLPGSTRFYRDEIASAIVSTVEDDYHPGVNTVEHGVNTASARRRHGANAAEPGVNTINPDTSTVDPGSHTVDPGSYTAHTGRAQ